MILPVADLFVYDFTDAPPQFEIADFRKELQQLLSGQGLDLMVRAEISLCENRRGRASETLTVIGNQQRQSPSSLSHSASQIQFITSHFPVVTDGCWFFASGQTEPKEGQQTWRKVFKKKLCCS